MGKFRVEFSGSFAVETELLAEVYRAKMVHLLEKFLQSETRLDGSVEIDDVALTVATRLGYDPSKRYFEIYPGGHGNPEVVAALNEHDARRVYREGKGFGRCPPYTKVVEVTGEMLQGRFHW